MSSRVAVLVATWFGCGYSPAAPGTAGSAAALAIAIVWNRFTGWNGWCFALVGLAILVPSIWAAGVTAQVVGKEDPGIVVVDEVIGQWITLAGAVSLNWKSYLFAFVLFRLFDIFKPVPVRQMEALPGGIGIIADDVMAGVYAALVLLVGGWFNLY